MASSDSSSAFARNGGYQLESHYCESRHNATLIGLQSGSESYRFLSFSVSDCVLGSPPVGV